MVWSIITWETSTMVHTVLNVTGQHVSHVRLDIWRYRTTRIHVRLHVSHRKTTNSKDNQVSSSCSKYHTVLCRSPPRHFVCRSPSRNVPETLEKTRLPVPVHLPSLHVMLFDVSRPNVWQCPVLLKKTVRNRIIWIFSGLDPEHWGLQNPEKNWIPVFFWICSSHFWRNPKTKIETILLWQWRQCEDLWYFVLPRDSTGQLLWCLMYMWSMCLLHVISVICYLMRICIHIILMWTGGGTWDTVLHTVTGVGGMGLELGPELGCWHLTRKRLCTSGIRVPSTDGHGSCLHTTYIQPTYIPHTYKIVGTHCPTPLLGRFTY
jgi:hypothetical protein